MRGEISVRAAVENEVALVLDFIRELADFEHLADEVVATEEDLHAALFGSRPYAEVVFACLDGEPVGFALYFHTFSTFLARPGLYLEDLYVRADKRGHGYGKLLFRHLAGLAVARGCGRLEWWVLDWNAPAIDFYRGLGAIAMDEWTVQRLTGDALKTFAES